MTPSFASCGSTLCREERASSSSSKTTRNWVRCVHPRHVHADGQYFNPRTTDPILYWSKSSLKILPSFAIDLLATPASSAPVERTFSATGIASHICADVGIDWQELI